MFLKLVVVGGDADPGEIQVRVPLTVGRGRQANLIVRHPLVSRNHCEIAASGGRLVVRDLGSLNGTFVNHERISEATLKSGDLLTIGAITFRAVFGPPTATIAGTKTRAAWPPAGGYPPPPQPAIARPASSEEPLTTALDDRGGSEGRVETDSATEPDESSPLGPKHPDQDG